MDFILAHSRFQRQKYTEAIAICDQLLQKNQKDEAAWVLKCECLIKQNYVDELQTEEEGLAQLLVKDNEKNQLAKVGTSFKANNNVNPIMRPLNSGRINTGFQRAGTSLGSKAGTRSNMLRTGRVMTKSGVPMTSNGRVLRLATASLQQHGQNFFDSSKVNMQKIAQRKSKARVIFLYLFYVEHNLKKALELAVFATELNNYKDPWWKLALGKCYYHLGFYPDAEKQFQSSIRHNNNIESYLYLSKLYEKQDNVEKSISILQKGTEMHPYEPKLHIAIARIHDQLQNLEESHQIYRKVIALQNCNIQAVANVAAYYFYKDQAEIAIKFYQRLVQLGYDAPEIWNNLALCCFANNQHDVFYTCFERAMVLGEDDPLLLTDVWYNIGHIYSVLGDMQMAVEAYSLSLTYMPDNIEALNNLAVIESRKNNVESAINYAQKSFRQLQNFQAAYNLSIWYLKINNFDKAFHYNKQALTLYPDHAQSLQISSKLLCKLDTL